MWFFFFQAEDGIRDLVRSRGLGDVYKRQEQVRAPDEHVARPVGRIVRIEARHFEFAGLERSLSLIHI